jgi:hypothetical protein
VRVFVRIEKYYISLNLCKLSKQAPVIYFILLKLSNYDDTPTGNLVYPEVSPGSGGAPVGELGVDDVKAAGL